MTDAARVHDLKTWPEFFGPLLDGTKTFEVRKADRDFRVGDTLRLREWLKPHWFTDEVDGRLAPEGVYTGRELTARVTYIATREFTPPGMVLMGIATAPAPLGEDEDELEWDELAAACGMYPEGHNRATFINRVQQTIAQATDGSTEPAPLGEAQAGSDEEIALDIATHLREEARGRRGNNRAALIAQAEWLEEIADRAAKYLAALRTRAGEA